MAEKLDKIAIVEITKVSSAIDINNGYRLVINNVDINTAKNLRLTNITKDKKCISKIQAKVD